jgi:aspartyl-tRNA(Asn)/glutamyl-tRNA(Gln) amidotransferase subunit B
MTENYKTTIGLEIHIQLNTASKMFSESSNTFSTKINSTINEYDIALPGSMPTVNKNAIIKAIRLANALNMFISKILNFDRKNYFY